VISVSCFGRVVVLYAQRNVVFTLSLSDSHMNCISLFFIKISDFSTALVYVNFWESAAGHWRDASFRECEGNGRHSNFARSACCTIER
jgi:hypothetical protein